MADSRIITLPTSYYCQYGTDVTLAYPADGMDGWKTDPLPLNLDKTAVVVMHAGYVGEPDNMPEQFAACEYVSRSYQIAERVFPKLLGAVREAGVRVYHIPFGTGYYEDLPGRKRVTALDVKPDPALCNYAEQDPVVEALLRHKVDFGMSSGAGMAEPMVARMREGYQKYLDFMPAAKPVGDEAIVENAAELAAVAKQDGVNHLIYIGFALDWCLLLSPGGMHEMQNRGFLCSTVRDAITAVECKESVRELSHTETALWRVGTRFGFVYDSETLISNL